MQTAGDRGRQGGTLISSLAQRYLRLSTGSTSAWTTVLTVFVASRLFYLASGALLSHIVPNNLVQHPGLPKLDIPFGTVNIWAHWDGEHYVSVAESGYEDASPAFFPLYPLLMRSIAELFGGPITATMLSAYGVFVSLVAFLFALYFVYRIAEDGWGTRTAQGAVWSLGFFPTSFFFNAVYTESLFLALSTGAVWAARVKGNAPLASILAGLSSATRSLGVLLLLPLLGEWAERRWYGRRLLYLALVPSGLVAYMGPLWWQQGSPLLFYGAQAEWGREPTWGGNLVDTFRLAYEDALRFFPEHEELLSALGDSGRLINLLFLLFALAVLLAGWRVLPLHLAVYALSLLVVPTLFAPASNPLLSEPRFMLVAFPIFVILGATILQSRRALIWWTLASAAISLVFTALFVGWYFVA